MNEKICVFLAIILLFTLVTGCSDSPKNKTEIYTVKSENAKFRGKLVSRSIEQYDYDSSTYELKVINGQKVSAGTVLLSLSDSGKESLSSSLKDEHDINATQTAKSTAANELNCIKKGDYLLSEVLSSEYSSLKEQLTEIPNEIRAQEIVIETAKINYEYELAALEKDLESPTEQMFETEVTDVTDETQPDGLTEETVDNTKILLEIEKLTKLYEKEQETNNLQLDKLKKQQSEVQSKINNFGSSLAVKNRIRELEQEIAGYTQTEQKYNQQVEALSSDCVVAKCDGLVVIDSNIIYVYGNTVDFRFTTTAQNFQKFYTPETQYNLQYNNEIVGTIELSYYVPSQTEDMYDLVYTVSSTKDVRLLTNTYAYMVSGEEIFIPTAYISQNDNGDFYVLKNGEEVKVEVTVIDGQYKMISGLNVGDKIEKIN